MSVIVEVFGARSDNFGYLVHDVATGRTAAIDAPETAAIKAALTRRGWCSNIRASSSVSGAFSARP